MVAKTHSGGLYLGTRADRQTTTGDRMGDSYVETDVTPAMLYFWTGVAWASLGTSSSIDNVSDPPTDAELDSAFGEPSLLDQPFLGVVDDSGAGSKIWLCVAIHDKWGTVEMTVAI